MSFVENPVTIKSCGICSSSSLEPLWDLPKLPLTEKYGPYSPEKKLFADQTLCFCNECGHVQLKAQLSPLSLYTPSSYSFRTSQSRTAQEGSNFFFQFYLSTCKEKTFHSFLDIGGNDLFLAKMVDAEQRCVIDPVASSENGQMIEGVKVIGDFIENVDLKAFSSPPDLIFCRHVLEHISKPKELLLKLFEECHPNALYIFEIPCFENLVEANRFDAIFHQHYHYFDLCTFQRLIKEAGGTYLSHMHNRQGSCGGSLLIAFEKAKAKNMSLELFSVEKRKKSFLSSIEQYQFQMRLLSHQIDKLHPNIYGYGASLMLATLAYHLKTDFSNLKCILDDDIEKENIGYQNLPVKVRYTGNLSLEPNSNFLITSLENIRPIFRKVTTFSPRRVLLPLIA